MTNNIFDPNLLSGKTVVITGAGRGIGLEVANLVAECGAKIIAHSGRLGSAKNLSGISSSVFEADFSDQNSVKQFIDFVQAQTSVMKQIHPATC